MAEMFRRLMGKRGVVIPEEAGAIPAPPPPFESEMGKVRASEADEEVTLSTKRPEAPRPANVYVPEVHGELDIYRDTEHRNYVMKSRIVGMYRNNVINTLSKITHRAPETFRSRGDAEILSIIEGVSRANLIKIDISPDGRINCRNGILYLDDKEFTGQTPGKFDKTAFFGTMGVLREVLIIDSEDKEYSEIYKSIYHDVLTQISNAKREHPDREPRVLKIITNVLGEAFGGTVGELNSVVRELEKEQGKREPEVNLGFFVTRKLGFCRHKIAMAGYILEKLSNDYENFNIFDEIKLSRGKVGKKSHAWLEIKTKEGILIYDPSHRINGELKDEVKKRSIWYQ